MRNPDMVYVFKMEYVSKINTFRLMRKAFFRSPDLLNKSEDLGLKIQISNKNDLLCAWRDFNKICFDVCTYHE